jgi:hypothetical protein
MINCIKLTAVCMRSIQDGRPRFDSRQVLFATASRRLWGSPIKWLAKASSLGSNQPGDDTKFLPAKRAEVKNLWYNISISPYVFVG